MTQQEKLREGSFLNLNGIKNSFYFIKLPVYEMEYSSIQKSMNHAYCGLISSF